MGKQMTEMLKGTLEGIVLATLATPAGVRLRDHGAAARSGLLRHRRGHRLRAADQDRTARPRRRREGPVREGAAAQGVLAQRHGRRVPPRVLGNVELPRRTHRTAPPQHRTNERRRRVIMAAKWYELITGSLEDKKAYRQYKARIAALPEPYGTAAKAFERYFMYNGGITDGDSAVMITMLERLRRSVGARRRRRDAGRGHRRRRPGRVRRGIRRGVRRQALDRQGAQAPHRNHPEPRREGRAMTTHQKPSHSRSGRASRSRSRTCTCCGASTST